MNRNEATEKERKEPILTRVILASGSKNRQALFSAFGIPFDVVPANINEEIIEDPDPATRAKKIAKAKAEFVAARNSGLIIAADTFSVFDGRYFQKPKNIAEAREMLRALSGNTMETVTGICIINTVKKQVKVTHRQVEIHCKTLTEDEIESYVTHRPVTEWAAAYNPLDAESIKIFKPVGIYPYKIEYNGLPVDVVSEALGKIGYKVDLRPFRRI